MATLYEAFSEVGEGIFRDELTSEVMADYMIEDILRHGEVEGYNFFSDNEGNVWRAVPSDDYDPATDLPLDELDIDEDEREEIEAGAFDDDARLAEIEQESGIWDDSEKFTLEPVYTFLGSMYDYFLKRAKEEFSEGDNITQDDIDGLSEGEFENDLSDEEYEAIALESTGNPLSDEED